MAAVPVVVSDGVESARALAGEELAFYETIPSYATVIAREKADRAVDLAAIGPADAVRNQLQRYLDAGATDLVLSPMRSNPADPQRLWEIAASI
jgi:alkanesulfonate monooxygenase SsuD/methylene tetrahydromethanopterin reductase-like flavin-dependent oxidoreductase (luciferase family)